MAFRHPRLTENKKTSQVRYNLTRFADSMFRGIQYVANLHKNLRFLRPFNKKNKTTHYLC